jgi:pyroglutamyl-peptidase
MKLLITGFEPFMGGRINNSWKIAQATVNAWQKLENPNYEIVCEQLPVSWHKTKGTLIDAVQKHNPTHLICLGLADGTQALRFETTAINEAFWIQDNDGEYYQKNQDAFKVPIDPNFEITQSFPSTLPKDWLFNSFEEDFIESHNAGGYLCNFTFYHAMTNFPQIQNKGFIHVGGSNHAKEVGVKVLLALAEEFKNQVITV